MPASFSANQRAVVSTKSVSATSACRQLHSLTDTNEQFVIEQLAQSSQSATSCRLTQVNTPTGPGHVFLDEQRLQYHEQV